MSKSKWEGMGPRAPARGVHLQISGPTVAFLTVKARSRDNWVASERIQTRLHEIWESRATTWRVGDYVLMPDHLHLFCAPLAFDVEIERWISYWKHLLSRSCPESGCWQRGGFHHRIRSQTEFDEKWSYMKENPIRAGLVVTSEEWPYQGKVYSVGWF